jgi:DNA-binding NtrC family response regulator
MESILIVDDEPQVRVFLTRLLVKNQYLVHESWDSASALGILATQPVAVVLCDRRLENDDGLDLVSKIQEQFPTVAIVMATADDSLARRVSQHRSVVGYLVKPFSPSLLLDAVADAVTWHHVASRSSRA